ncbi:hypothetical protein [Fluviicola sp.]|uniref:hypothetical protein n=1 Tax=Fluviicola sp. TaxID=1917219 RepID=UPI0031E254B1
MIRKQLLVFLLGITTFSACNSGTPKEEKTNAVLQAEKPKTVHSEKKKQAISEDSEQTPDIPDTGNIFRRYDAVKKVLKKWNQAISDHQLSDLENLYADEVIYYSKKSSKQTILNQKSSWLKKHPSYKQKLGYTDVYFDQDDIQEVEEPVLKVAFVARFTKICIENGKKKEVESYLYFRKFGNKWKIVCETDAITEVNVALNKPVMDLPEGEYHYYIGQWSDTRDVPGFAHDMAPYDSRLDFTIKDGEILGVYDWYSGTLRSHIFYLIKSGKIKNGILELEIVYCEVDIPSIPEHIDDIEEDYLSKETETWSFKILDNKQLIGISKDCYSYSQTLKRIN